MYLNCYKFSSGVDVALWDQVNLVFYNIIPFMVMITFNSLLIINLKNKFRKSKDNNSSHIRPSLTLSLIILSFIFVIMTTPGTIMFAYFYNAIFADLDQSLVFLVDDISFMNHAILFFISFISIRKFRKTIIRLCFKQHTDSQKAASFTITT